ncbi:MAG: DUF11 domain-containing protein [Planctomycetaceae bacterium]|nr:DUF11 domain-containing protein [Planctomycetaceae bacterium]
MRTGLIILTTLLLMAGGWGLLSAQNNVLDELPENLVPSDLDNRFYLDEVERETLERIPNDEPRFFEKENRSLSVTAKRNLGEGQFHEFETGFSDDFEAKIMQAGLEEDRQGGFSKIQQISSKDDNPFFKNAEVEAGTTSETDSNTETELSFPQFPAFNLEPQNPEEELEELAEQEEQAESTGNPFAIESETKSPAFQPEVESTDSQMPVFSLTPQATKTNNAPSTGASNNFSAGRFEPAPWSELTVKGPVTPSVAARWVNKGVLNVGQPTECELQVRNISATPVHDFLIDTVLPSHVELISSAPEVSLNEGQLTWQVDHLKADEQLSFKVVFIPHQRGPLMAEAHIRFSSMTAAAFHVEEPMLKLALEGAQKVMIGESATQVISIMNPGTGVAQNVVIHAEIPEGLEHAQGKNVALPVGSLNPGEKRRIRLPLVCIAGGTQELKVSAVAESGLTEVATTSVDVVAPELALLAEGPRLRFVGRTATYRLTVNNIGSAESSNVRLLHKVPEGFDFVQADKGGKFNADSRVVQWFVGRLEPGQTTEVQVQLEATALGAGIQRFAAVSDQATRTEATVETDVDGTPSLVLEILDLDDPVEVGRETAYEIRVRNVGSKAAQQVEVKCDLPEGIAFKAARGPSAHKQADNTIFFRPLPQLPAGETAIFRVHVVGNLAGKQNVSVELKSRDDEEPLVYQEQTRYYQD